MRQNQPIRGAGLRRRRRRRVCDLWRRSAHALFSECVGLLFLNAVLGRAARCPPGIASLFYLWPCHRLSFSLRRCYTSLRLSGLSVYNLEDPSRQTRQRHTTAAPPAGRVRPAPRARTD
eukprot:Rhum_TRINITY_DN14150_c2_g1::Rhum_TRINITY_DN14150_c2_g1_i2::g.70173::m.70173